MFQISNRPSAEPDFIRYKTTAKAIGTGSQRQYFFRRCQLTINTTQATANMAALLNVKAIITSDDNSMNFQSHTNQQFCLFFLQ